FVQFVDEHGAARAQAVDDEAVVDDFVTHVDWRAERLQRALDDLDRAVDAGAEATWVGQENVHGGIIGLPAENRGRLWQSGGTHWRSSAVTPPTLLRPASTRHERDWPTAYAPSSGT